MAKHKISYALFISLIVILLVSCSNSEMEPESKIISEEAEQTMNNFFTALSEADTVLLNRVTTEDFTLYEHDEIWNRDSLLSLMAHTQGRIWVIRDFESLSEGNIAHVYYHNISREPAGRSWLESALLIQKNDEIKIAFMHSTKLYLDN